MLWTLSAALSLWYKGGRPFLTEAEVLESTALCRFHMVSYQHLASMNLEEGKLLYKIRPTGHYFDHLITRTAITHANPISFANFVDEDQMKSLRGVVQGCHFNTMLTQWAKRYTLKKVLLWDRLAKV